MRPYTLQEPTRHCTRQISLGFIVADTQERSHLGTTGRSAKMPHRLGDGVPSRPNGIGVQHTVFLKGGVSHPIGRHAELPEK
jgi:hypothetical protein